MEEHFFCPRCGEKKLHCVEIAATDSEGNVGSEGYDTYCDACGWSVDMFGDLLPGDDRLPPGEMRDWRKQ